MGASMVPLVGSGWPWTSVVPLVDRTLLELPLERGVRPLRLGHDHQARGTHVEAVHDALALGGTGGRDAVPGGGEPADHGRPGPAGAGMRGDTHGLDDHDHVVVVMDDLHALDRLGDDLHRRGRLWHLDLQPGPAVRPLGLTDHRPVDRDLPRGGDLGRLGPGEAEHAGDGGVDALALQAVGHGQGTDLGNGAHPSSMPDTTDSPDRRLWISPCGPCRRGRAP